MDFFAPAKEVLDLDNIRRALIRMEDTILFYLIERAQFRENGLIYKKGSFESLGKDVSFLDWMLRETESLHSKVRRFDAPDENAFYPDAIQPTILPRFKFPRALADYQKEINVNDLIKEYYIKNVVKSLAFSKGEDCNTIGSCAGVDVQCLQALSRRVHLGKYVAESKFISDHDALVPMIKSRDVEGITRQITKPEMEAKILERVKTKADIFGTNPQTLLKPSEGEGKIDPDAIVQIYRELVIPLTKKVEVDYLLRRLDDDSKKN